jgi:hypothetical protein
MKLKSQILLFLITSFLCLSCEETQEPEDKEDTTQMIKECLKPYLFRTDSYWIFKNDSTGIVDSMAVIEFDSGSYWMPPPVHGAPGQKWEYYNIFVMNFMDSVIHNDFLDRNHIRRNGGGNYGELGQPILIADGVVGDGYNGMQIIDIIPELDISGNTFFNVIDVKVTASKQYQQEFDYDTYLYFKDSIGIVKQVEHRSIEDIRSWSLIRWKIKF